MYTNASPVLGCNSDHFHQGQLALVPVPEVLKTGAISRHRGPRRDNRHGRHCISKSVYAHEYQSTDFHAFQSVWDCEFGSHVVSSTRMLLPRLQSPEYDISDLHHSVIIIATLPTFGRRWIQQPPGLASTTQCGCWCWRWSSSW